MTLSTVQQKQCIDLLENYIKAVISYEKSIAFHLKEGSTIDTDGEDSIHDFLNEHGGLFGDEYEQLKAVFAGYWEDNDIEVSFNINSPDYKCPVGFVKANYSRLFSLKHDTRELISYLADSQNEFNDAEQAGELSEDEAADGFGDLLASYGLDCFLYGELFEMEWVEVD